MVNAIFSYLHLFILNFCSIIVHILVINIHSAFDKDKRSFTPMLHALFMK